MHRERNRRLHLPKQYDAVKNSAYIEPSDLPHKIIFAFCETVLYSTGNYVRTVMETKVADTTREVDREGQEGRFKA